MTHLMLHAILNMHPEMHWLCPLIMFSGCHRGTAKIFPEHIDQSSIIQHCGPGYMKENSKIGADAFIFNGV